MVRNLDGIGAVKAYGWAKYGSLVDPTLEVPVDKIVHWTIEVDTKDGRVDDFRSLMKEMVDATKDSEPQALSYEWTSTNDGATWQVYERYTDSDATMVHMNNFFANFAKRFLDCVDVKRLDIYGTPDETVRKTMKPLGPRYFDSEGGFTR